MQTPERVDMQSYARRAHFDYFRNMANPYVGVTVNVEITAFLRAVKSKKLPFFLSFLYRVAGAANAVPELRERIEGEGIVRYAYCPTSHTVARPDGTYGYCTLDARLPFETYLADAVQKQTSAQRGAGLSEDGDAQSLLFISTVPWFSYTSLLQPTPSPADSNPRITWGKFFAQGEQALMPVTLLCHHALVDGRHIGLFFEALGEGLKI